MSKPLFTRYLHYGCVGADVVALKRALRHAGFRPAKKEGQHDYPQFGHTLTKELNAFKGAYHLPAPGRYGPKSLEALWPHYDGYSKLLQKYAYEKLHKEDARKKGVRICLYAYSQRDYMHYTQDSRRMTDFGPPPNIPNWTDCSGAATWVYKSTGLPDPNGMGYNGYGYTGTMTENGRVVPMNALKELDLIFYGKPGINHVGIYIGGNRVWEFGSEPGPYILDPYYRSDLNHARRYFD